jgi:hypothetical protein
MKRVAVFHDSHTVGYDIATWMLHDLGYEVYAAGDSFRSLLPNYRSFRYPPGNSFLTRSNGRDPWDGVMELKDLRDDMLFVDTFPDSEHALRRYGWNGPLLLYWILPVGRDYIAKGNFCPGKRVVVLAFNAAIARMIRERELCPVSLVLPPYHQVANFAVRKTFEPFLVAVVNKLVDWVPSPVCKRIARLTQHPKIKLELYGQPPPTCATPIEHTDLVARMARAKALFHVKTIDTPGYAWMEAALQGVPVIFRPAFVDHTEFAFLEHGRTCLFAERMKELSRCAQQLADPAENQRLGLALRETVIELCSWRKNRTIVEALLRSVHEC